jgi:N-acetylneuraminate synthase
MSSYSDVDALVKLLEELCPRKYAIFQCTTQYPTSPDVVGMNVLDEYMRRYSCPVGLSDHSGTIFPSLIASWSGARLIEVHVTLSRDMFGPDVSSSLTADQLTILAEGIRFVHSMRSSPVDKDAMAIKKDDLRRLFGKSAVATRGLKVGDVVSEQDVTFRKPGHGVPELAFEAYLGRRLKRQVTAGKFFQEEDFE